MLSGELPRLQPYPYSADLEPFFRDASPTIYPLDGDNTLFPHHFCPDFSPHTYHTDRFFNLRRRAPAAPRPSSSRAAGAGGSSNTMLKLYTDSGEAGLKVYVLLPFSPSRD